MRIDKQARGKTRKKYGRSVRRFAALIRWGSIVLGVLVGLTVMLSVSFGGLVEVETTEITEMMEMVGDDTSIGIIGSADGPTSMMVSEPEADTDMLVGGIVAGVLYMLAIIVSGWLSSSLLYAFAQLLYCQEEIVAQNTKQIKLLEKIAGMTDSDEE